MGAVSMLFSIPVAMRHERSAEGLAGDEETGDFGYTSLYGQLPDYDKKRTESVESLATPFVSSERPWETIFSGSTLNFPPLLKLCGEFFESLMEKRTVVVEWVMIYTKKVNGRGGYELSSCLADLDGQQYLFQIRITLYNFTPRHRSEGESSSNPPQLDLQSKEPHASARIPVMRLQT
ncbi:hypothetical protein Bca4012_041866 [Brassica carinata]